MLWLATSSSGLKPVTVTGTGCVQQCGGTSSDLRPRQALAAFGIGKQAAFTGVCKVDSFTTDMLSKQQQQQCSPT